MRLLRAICLLPLPLVCALTATAQTAGDAQTEAEPTSRAEILQQQRVEKSGGLAGC